MAYPHNLSQAINSYETWLKELEEKPAIQSPDDAWSAMGAVLQTLRDRMPAEEAVHLGAQLPLIARGVFYEGWKLTREPDKMDQQQFYDRVRERLAGSSPQADPALITEYVFKVINHHIDPGQIGHIKDILPAELQNLWPSQKAA